MRVLLAMVLLLIGGAADAQNTYWNPVVHSWGVIDISVRGCQTFEDLEQARKLIGSQDSTAIHGFDEQRCVNLAQGTRVWVSEIRTLSVKSFHGIRVRPEGTASDVWILSFEFKPPVHF